MKKLKIILGILVIILFNVGFLLAEETTGIDFKKVLHDLSAAILDILIPVLVTGIGILVKKALDTIKIGFVRTWVRNWVLSAYQKFASGEHQQKIDYVAKKVHEKFPYLTEDEVKDFIEAAVKGVKLELGKEN